MAKTVTPKWDEANAIRRGRAAHHLAVTYRSAVEPRLQPETIDGLLADIESLSASGPDRQATKTKQKGRTGHERSVARDGHDWVMQVREMAKRTSDVDAGERKALGVGEKVNAGSTTQVLAAIDACAQAFADHPGLLEKIGLLETDVADGKAIAELLVAADDSQSETMTERKDKTFDRNAVQLRIEAAVDRISSRGAMAFRTDVEIRSRFSALISTAGPTVKTDVDTPTASEG